MVENRHFLGGALALLRTLKRWGRAWSSRATRLRCCSAATSWRR